MAFRAIVDMLAKGQAHSGSLRQLRCVWGFPSCSGSRGRPRALVHSSSFVLGTVNFLRLHFHFLALSSNIHFILSHLIKALRIKDFWSYAEGGNYDHRRPFKGEASILGVTVAMFLAC